MTKRAEASCDDCYFRKAGLCALPLDSPCPTFRPAKPRSLRPPQQPRLVPRPERELVDLVAFEIDIPDTLEIESVALADLPKDWRLPGHPGCRAIGDTWLAEERTAVLRVPSAVVPEELNYIINPRHPAAKAIEIIGRRWTGAILEVLLQHGGALRYKEIAHAVPQLSDRLLSERMKELEARGIVERRVGGTSPARVEYELTEMGRDLAPALAELEAWAHRWIESP